MINIKARGRLQHVLTMQAPPVVVCGALSSMLLTLLSTSAAAKPRSPPPLLSARLPSVLPSVLVGCGAPQTDSGLPSSGSWGRPAACGACERCYHVSS